MLIVIIHAHILINIPYLPRHEKEALHLPLR